MAAIALGDGAAGAREVQVDLELAEDGPVAGFSDVPLGPHRLSLRSGTIWSHEWFRVATEAETLVVAGGDGAEKLAADGPFSRFPRVQASRWASLTANLRRHWGAGLAAETTAERLGRTPAPATRPLDGLLADAGSALGYLAELEQTFLDGFLSPDTGDLAAIARWRRLVGAVAGASRSELVASPPLFAGAVEALGFEVELLGIDLLDDSLAYELEFLAVELLRCDDPGLGLAGIALDRMLHA